MPDRTRPPQIHPINQLTLPLPQRYRLDNGVPVYCVNLGTQDILKLEIVFFAGRCYEKQAIAGRATVNQLKEGAGNFHSADIAEYLDFYGANLRLPANLDTAQVTLFCLRKHIEQLLPMLSVLVSRPTFPKEELESFIHRNQQRLRVDLTKTDVVAYRIITELIFGADHPYGYNSSPATYGALHREPLVEHFNRCYNDHNCLIVLSGKVPPELVEQLNRYLGHSLRPGTAAQADLSRNERSPESFRVDMPGTVQTAIRIGRRLFNRHHPDFPGMYVLNTILGGYFGSRLMTNIREDKGYTYNIYSLLDIMRHDGCFYISTEVGNNFLADTLEQIYAEMERLQCEPVEKEELDMVRNYLLGALLTSLDGPFNVAELIKTIVTEDLPFDSFTALVRTIQTIQPGELQALAQKYLRREDMWEVIVGG